MHDDALADLAQARAFEAMPTMMVAGPELLALLHQHTGARTIAKQGALTDGPANHVA
jgi:hypothetical protein